MWNLRNFQEKPVKAVSLPCTHVTSIFKLLMILVTQNVPELEFYNWIYCFMRKSSEKSCDRFHYCSEYLLPSFEDEYKLPPC